MTGHGDLIQVLYCHCVDCRKANGNKAFETLAMIARSQVGTKERLDITGPYEVMAPEEFKYFVPRVRCSKCKSFLLADVSGCPEILGYNMAMVPVEWIKFADGSGVDQEVEYQIHMTEQTEPPPADPSAQYDSHPGGDHGKVLNAALKAAGKLK